MVFKLISSRKNFFSWFCLCLFAFSGSLFSAEDPQDFKKTIEPYLLPADHPIKPILDAIFNSSRAIFNLNTLEQAGFKPTAPRKFTQLIVTQHPAVPGFIFKLYLDSQRYYKDLQEHEFWIMRIQGADKVRQEIANCGLEAIFKVPHKWIYCLPTCPKPPSGYYPKLTILVEEDMLLIADKDNKALWGSSYITPQLLDSLFYLLKEVGLYDGAKPDNIPFSSDGRIAFVDTQTFGRKTVNYKKLLPFLSKENRIYWKALIKLTSL